ncbi:MAG TPA: molybdenum cofactor guanylyltransferase [Candidatus Acidoferrales bacterium]
MSGGCQVDAFVLAGGVSSRMGRAKGLLEFGGVPLIVRIVRLAEAVAGRAVVVGSPEIYAALGLNAIADQDIGVERDASRSGGPLFGIATALSQSRAPRCLILACDLPYLTSDWLRWFVERSIQSRAQVVVPMTGEKLQPLAAIYRAECAFVASRLLKRGVRSAIGLLEELQVERVPENEWRVEDHSGNVLKNMNSPQDYEEALESWNSKGFRAHT